MPCAFLFRSLRLSCFGLVLLVLPCLPARGAVVHFAQIGDGVEGDLRVTTTLVLASLGEGGPVRIDFFNSDASPMPIEFTGFPAGSSLQLDLERGQSLSLSSAGKGVLRSGFARVSSEGPVQGTAVFTGSSLSQSRPLFEAGVPATDSLAKFTLFVDSRGNTDSALALVNPADQGPPAEVDLKLLDAQYSLVGTTSFRLPPGEHRARFIHELFEGKTAEQAREFQGVLVVESSLPLNALTLRFNGDGPTLTAFPVMEGTAEIGASAEFFYSFENDLQGWVRDATDLELAGGEIEWSIEPTDVRAFHGDYALLYSLENLNDAGKIWVRRGFPVQPSTRYKVTVAYQFGTGDSDINAFTIITGVSIKPPTTRDTLQYQGKTSNGTGEPGFLWLPKEYTFSVESGRDGLLWVTVGIWGTWETPRKYVVDALSIRFTRE